MKMHAKTISAIPSLLPALLFAVCTGTLASPIETLTLPPATNPSPLISDGFGGSSANRVVSITPTSAGTVRSLRLDGLLNSVNPLTHGLEARIQITPPGRAPVFVQPFPRTLEFTTLAMTNLRVNIPATVANSGPWEVRFFESVDGSGIDAQWDDGLSIVLDDALPAVATPPATDLGPLVTGPIILADQAFEPGEIRWYRFTITGASAVENTFLDIDTGFNPDQDTEIGLYHSNGTLIDSDDDSGSDFLSQLTFGAGTRCPLPGGLPFDGFNGDLPAGEYYLAVGYHNVNFGGSFNVSTADLVGGTLRINFNSGVQLPNATPVANLALGALAATPEYVNSFTAAVPPAGTYWLSFNVPDGIDSFSRSFLDIDTEGTDGIDTTLLVFNASTGAFLAGDGGGGSGANSQLSWGSGYRPGVGDGFPYDGFLGDLLPGDSLLIAVVTAPIDSFGDGFFFCSSGTGGDITINIRTGVQPAATTPVSIDLGNITDATPNAALAGVALAPAETKWFKFNLMRDPNAPTFYLDIDTEGSSLAPTNDTFMVLFTDTGNIFDGGAGIVFDDDTGSGLLSQLSFGNATPRASVGTIAPYSNQNGQVTSGQYFLAVTGFPTNAYLDEWAVFSTSENTGTINLTLATSSALPPVICLADINGDQVVDGGDFILFINSFSVGDITQDSNADVNADAVIDGGDFIAFINAFASGC